MFIIIFLTILKAGTCFLHALTHLIPANYSLHHSPAIQRFAIFLFSMMIMNTGATDNFLGSPQLFGEGMEGRTGSSILSMSFLGK